MKKTIICIDDEVSILISIKEQLRNYFGDKYDYEMIQNGYEALELIDSLMLNEKKIILIVSDWLMADIKGDELLIKVHNKYPQLITVMLTGQASSEAIENVRKNAKLFACLHKPWRGEELANLINSAEELLI